MIIKTTLALTFVFAVASGALAATKQSLAPHNDTYDRASYDQLDIGRDCVRVAFPQCGGN
jgi:hypothetical protein